MKIEKLLNLKRNEIVGQANKSLERVHLKHYDRDSCEINHERLKRLFELSVKSVSERNLKYINNYVRDLSEERFRSGFGISEVQTAFNVLEEVIWKTVIRELPPDEIADALSLISTVLGAGKEILAVKYVSLAGKSSEDMIDQKNLFKGTDGI